MNKIDWEKVSQKEDKVRAHLAEIGQGMIKPEKENEWKKFSQEASISALSIVVSSMRFISNDGIKEAKKKISVISDFGKLITVLQAVCYFSARGEEFRKEWNGLFGVKTAGILLNTGLIVSCK